MLYTDMPYCYYYYYFFHLKLKVTLNLKIYVNKFPEYIRIKGLNRFFLFSCFEKMLKLLVVLINITCSLVMLATMLKIVIEHVATKKHEGC